MSIACIPCRSLLDPVLSEPSLAAVDEGGLRVHIAGLRKALGGGIGDTRYIKNVPGRGYCLVVPSNGGASTANLSRRVEVRLDHPACRCSCIE
jgi:DNA-binding winged helix-turn-helix (wHTH) protein